MIVFSWFSSFNVLSSNDYPKFCSILSCHGLSLSVVIVLEQLHDGHIKSM